MTNTVKLVMLILAAMTRTLCERFQKRFLTDLASLAINHVSILESYPGCKDFWVVIDFLYFLSQSSLLSLDNFTSIGCWECGCTLIPPTPLWSQLSVPYLMAGDLVWLVLGSLSISTHSNQPNFFFTFLSCLKDLELCDFLIFHPVKHIAFRNILMTNKKPIRINSHINTCEESVIWQINYISLLHANMESIYCKYNGNKVFTSWIWKKHWTSSNLDVHLIYKSLSNQLINMLPKYMKCIFLLKTTNSLRNIFLIISIHWLTLPVGVGQDKSISSSSIFFSFRCLQKALIRIFCRLTIPFHQIS